MDIYQYILIACWFVFIAYWALSALRAKRSTRHSWMITWVWRLIFIAAFYLAVRSGAHVDASLWSSRTPLPAFEPVGVLLCIVGVAFAIWARIYLGRNWGMPMTRRLEPELVTSGPYAYVRHPIYTGVLLAILGSVLASGFWWVVVFVCAAIYFLFSATREEKFMAETFPEQYPAYKGRTKMLIPFIL